MSIFDPPTEAQRAKGAEIADCPAVQMSPAASRTISRAAQTLPTCKSWCLVLLAAMALVVALCHFAAAAGRRYQVREVKPHIFVWIPEDIVEEDSDPDFPRAGTAGFAITTQGVAVIDTTNTPFHGGELLYEIRERTDQPVKYVINTNASADQTFGNEVFADERATILSTAAARAAMRGRAVSLDQRTAADPRLKERLRGIHIRLPNDTFTTELPVTLGGEAFRVIDLDAGGTAGDAAVYFPAEKVLFLGDLFQNRYFPRLEGRDIHRWIDVLRTTEAWNADVCVPGHGEPGAKADVVAFRRFLEWIANEVETRVQEGKSAAVVKQELVPLRNYRWRAPENAATFVGAVYEELCESSQALAGSAPGAHCHEK